MVLQGSVIEALERSIMLEFLASLKWTTRGAGTAPVREALGSLRAAPSLPLKSWFSYPP